MNNFDMSTSGVSIEFDGHYSIDLSSIYFEDEFKLVEDHEVEENGLELGFNEDIDIGTVFKAITDQLDSTQVEGLCYDLNIAGFRELDVTHDELYYAAKEFFYVADFYEHFEQFLNYKFIKTLGYSEGDWCNVYLHLDSYHTQETLSNLIYNTPISGMIKIDANDYYIDEFLDNYYLWDRDGFIKKFTGHLTGSGKFSDEKLRYIKDWLSDNLPTDLEYS